MAEGQASRAPSRLAVAVREQRKLKGWTSERLAKEIGMSHSWVRNFEIGIIPTAPAKRIRAMEQALGMKTGELYATALEVPYDVLLEELLAEQDTRTAPWKEMVELQRQTLKAIQKLDRRISPSAAVDQDAVQELVESAVVQGVRRGRERAALPPEDGEAS